MTRLEGLFVGGSGGAAVAGAIKYARSMIERGEATVGDRPARILVILADAGHKYLSKIFNDEWMRENGFLEDTPGLGTVADILAARDGRPLVTVRPDAKLRDVVALMKSTSISQLPVIEAGGKLRGIVAEVDVLRALVAGGKTLESPISEVVEDDYATVTPDTKVELLQGVLADAKAAIVEDEGETASSASSRASISSTSSSKQSPAVVPPTSIIPGAI